MPRKPPTTAGELLARLEADPEHLARERKRDADVAAMAAADRVEEASLVAELAAVGYVVDSAWGLLQAAPYPRAIPILLEHVRRDYTPRIREAIARALGVKYARHAWDEIKALYVETAEWRTKDALAATLDKLADRELVPDLIALALDRRNGPSRVLFLNTIWRAKTPEGRAALAALADDPEVSPQLAEIAKKQRRSEQRHAKPRR